MKDFSKYTRLIEDAINGLGLPGGDLAGLYDPIKYGLDCGGKRLRPLLTLLAADALGCEPKDAMPNALAVEIFHNFTLLHDDVMDNSSTRRGRPSVMAKYGTDAAILSGDTMLSIAYKQILQSDSPRRLEALECLNNTAIEVYEGQQLDMDFENRSDVTLPEYLEMIRLKTSVLLGCAAKLGAMAANAPEQTADALYDYGLYLGLAFQIIDDWLDVYGDAATFGKPIGGDILNDKKTWLRIKADEAGASQEIAHIVEQYDSELRIAKVKDVYERLSVPTMALAQAEEYTRSSLKALETADLSAEWKSEFIALAERLTTRTK